MKLAEDEFWRCTPKLFAHLLDEYAEEQRQEDYRAGIVAALIANSIPSKKKRKPSKPADFFPSLKKRQYNTGNQD